MTQDEIIEMAEQCGIDPHDMCEDPRIAINNLEAFAKLVAAKEREECAKFIEDGYMRQFEKPWREDLSAAIRARGEA
jgi:hypothetical protein